MDEIRTSRLTLRRAALADLDDLHAVLSHPGAMRYWSTLPHADLDETREWLERMIAAPPQESDDFVIDYRGKVIGKAGCWRVAEVGFILHPDLWGRGLAREALAAVIPHAFATFPVAALTAEADPRNAPSLRLLASLGFVEAGRAARTWNIGGEWSDSVFLALPRPN